MKLFNFVRIIRLITVPTCYYRDSGKYYHHSTKLYRKYHKFVAACIVMSVQHEYNNANGNKRVIFFLV